MATKEVYEQTVEGDDRIVGRKGRVGIPQELRERFGIERGDTVGFRETDRGTIEIVPPPKE
jgi:AbrB family looped-hinge helix DNA binding protein